MLNILRVSGFYDTGIFFIGKYKENNVYYIEVNDPDDISAGYIIKTLLIQNTIVNTLW